ncbi:MAG: 2-hydroxychromene-2-carboxylate isomerase [Polyangiales bacterium]
MTYSQPLELWFEFASTYSYLAVEAAGRLEQPQLPLRYRPFLLGPIFAAQGWNDSPFNLFPAKGRYMLRDMARLCDDAGLPWRAPTHFPRSGLLAARVAIAHAEAAWLPAFCRRVYRANFGEDREIQEPSVIKELLREQDLDAEAILERAQASVTKQALKEQTSRASELGIFGAPTWVVGSELFWGNDRLAQAIAWWKRSAAPGTP